MTDTLQMRKVISLKGQVEVITGLHIGAGKESVEIGGMDQPVIKDPASGEPYIPGSSLKGKMRSLLEWKLDGKLDAGGKVHSCTDPDCVICRIFGSTAESDGRGPTRLVVRDCPLSVESRDAFRKGRALLETKYENTINRVMGRAGNPRPLERVVPGTKFDFEILYRVLDEADEANFRIVLEGLQALERDYLGGCGSRGSGQVRILIEKEGTGYEPLSDYLARLG
jgi:CRISPR-associated protein Csm3